MEQNQLRIRLLLEDLSSKVRRQRFLRGCLCFGTILSGLLLITLFVHLSFGIDAVSRFALLMVTGSIVLTVLVYQVFLPLAKKPGIRDIARALDVSVNELESSLLPVLDISEMKGNPRRQFSEKLMELAGRRTWKSLEGLSREKIHRAAGLSKRSRMMVVLIILLGSIGAWYLPNRFWRKSSTAAWADIVHPIRSLTEESIWRYTVSPGDTSLQRGTIPVIRMSLEDQDFEPLFRKPVPEIHYRVGSGKWNESPMFPGEDGNCLALLGPLVSAGSYYLVFSNKRSKEYLLDVFDLPSVTRMQYKLRYPEYSGLEDEVVIDQGGGLSVLRGTVVDISGSSNNVLHSAWMEIDRSGDGENEGEGGRRVMELQRGRSFIDSFEANESLRFRVKLIDSLGNTGGDSLGREVSVFPDHQPSVTILMPAQDIMAPKDLELPLVFRVEDDFGVTRVDLVYRVGEDGKGDRQKVRLSRSRVPAQILQDRIVWDLSKVDASVGDVVFYHLEALDNDGVSGPKKGRSKIYSVKFPTMTEFLKRQIEGGDQIRGGVEDILAEARRLSELSGELEKKLRGVEEVDWEKQKEIEAVAKRGEDLLEEINEVCSMIENSLEEGNENIFSDEVLEKMVEVRDLLDRFATPEMREAIERMKRAFESLPPNLVEQAMKNFRLKQDQLVKNLDRTLTALRRLELEQRLEAIEKGLRELGEKQSRVNRELEQTSAHELSQMAGEEEKIGSELSALTREMETTAERMADRGEMEASEEMAQIADAAGGEVSTEISDMVASLEQGLESAAGENGERARENLRVLEQRVGGLTSRLRSRWKEGTEKAIARALSDLVTLSVEQEEIVKRTRGYGNRFGPGVGEEIRAEQELVAGLQVVSEYLDRSAESSFFIGPDVILFLGMSVAKGHEMAVELNRGEKTPGEIAKLGGETLSYLNKTAARLLDDLQTLQCSASGVGLEEAFQQMEQLAQMQGGVNQGTQELMMPIPRIGENIAHGEREGPPLGARSTAESDCRRYGATGVRGLTGSKEYPGQAAGARGRGGRHIKTDGNSPGESRDAREAEKNTHQDARCAEVDAGERLLPETQGGVGRSHTSSSSGVTR